MVISIASGKGGTGKTTLAVNLALSLANVEVLDCDVEEPNVHLFLKPKIRHEDKAYLLVPEVEKEKCDFCGICQEVCAYNAIAVLKPTSKTKGNVLVFAALCHSCGACSLLCPQKAIKEVKKEIGVVVNGGLESIDFVGGRLNVGEAMAPPLIEQVLKCISRTKTVIIDAPPGASCSMISAVKESDFCILVTEPTPFGLNDLILAVEVLRKLKISFGVVINRSDIGDSAVLDYCVREDIVVLMQIPFEEKIARAYSQGITIVDILPEYKDKFRSLNNQIIRIIAKRNGFGYIKKNETNCCN
ncbi:MAG: (4Fe-4S)-binding protein [Candidatus Omnitrophota bacterium]|nr:MAG: (4Fe-4S)-binding protein [Candidatus Omnitrophota bacterium]